MDKTGGKSLTCFASQTHRLSLFPFRDPNIKFTEILRKIISLIINYLDSENAGAG